MRTIYGVMVILSALSLASCSGSSVATTTETTEIAAIPLKPPCATDESPEFADGDGTSGNPYIVATVCQLNEIRKHLSSYYSLANDLDLENINFDPIGVPNPISTPTTAQVFSGVFEGNSHSISNWTFTDTEGNLLKPIGLFSHMMKGTGASFDPAISNLNLVNVSITGHDNTTGTLVGTIGGGIITNCHATGTLTVIPVTLLNLAGNPNQVTVGGLIGSINGGTTATVQQSSSSVDVTVGGGPSQIIAFAGGLMGWSGGASIVKSHASGNIEAINGDFTSIGGLIGYFYSTGGTVTKSYYSGGTIKSQAGAPQGTGGLVGLGAAFTISDSYSNAVIQGGLTKTGGILGAGETNLTRVYAAGPITGGASKTGALIGEGSGTITNSVWDSQTTGLGSSVGAGTASGGTTKTTAQMKNASAVATHYSGWDFTPTTGIWFITSGYYPTLLP